ncbi:DUF3810 domain-containing protein [Flavobacterium sp.]|uniref:DUF3810 domain-containing protein n=1 Tax=Flavobacterium sp. TaxID=239 RepID=UPI00261E1971|nr:DUF3810 domain-containing protein [Flavobacterium sp.]MDD2986692.1 DUF3810 domain-containing protein [Flavobacterium sp.]
MVQKKYILPLLLLIQLIVLKIASLFPKFIEAFYSNGIYPFLSKFLRITFGFTSISIGDVLYGIVLFLVFKWFWNVRKTWKINWKDNLLKILSFASVFYFLFHFLWATNYHRVPLNEKLEIDKEYSTAELEVFTMELIEKTNAIHHQITKNDSLKVTIPYSTKEIFEKSVQSYQSTEKHFSFLKYQNESIKPSLISIPLSYMGFGGYLNPFTNEAQVNDCLPKYNFPTTTLHEMAHQIGYASESEANFIGFLASVKSDDIYFQYSGYSFAVKHCLRNLERIEEGKSKKFVPFINRGILKNYEESKQFNEQYQSFIEPIFETFYDNFLKFNQQKDGMEGYSKFVGLMIGLGRK